MQRTPFTDLNLLALRRKYTDPQSLYTKMRDQDSIFFDASSQSWLVTGHKAVTTILDDPQFTSELASVTNTSSKQMPSVSRQLLFIDGERHHKGLDVMLRSLALAMKKMPEVIRTYVRTALEPVYITKEMDCVQTFAGPIALYTIAHILGIPTNDSAMLRQLEQWSDTFGDVTSGFFQGNIQDVKKLEDYFRQLIREKRQSPSEDLLSALIGAKDIFPEDDDLIANCMMVFSAGRITTKKLLGNGVSMLIEQWEHHQAEMKDNPRYSKLLGEELLRMITPTRCLTREAKQDVDLSALFPGEHLIRKGQRVLLFLEAANYDADIFADPLVFQPQRRPNRQIAFGYGPHQCPGAALARVEIQIALEELLALSHPHPKSDAQPRWHPNPNLGGFHSCPMKFD